MSMAYERPSLAIHFTWKPEWSAVKQVLPQIEAALEPFEPRPHWGKLFTLAPAKLQPRYPRLTNFRDLVKHYDPSAKFRNEFVEKNLYELMSRCVRIRGLRTYSPGKSRMDRARDVAAWIERRRL